MIALYDLFQRANAERRAVAVSQKPAVEPPRKAGSAAGRRTAVTCPSNAQNNGDFLRTAYCFTPDRAVLRAGRRAIASLIEAEPERPARFSSSASRSDAPPGFDKLARRLRDRIELVTIDFARYDKN